LIVVPFALVHFLSVRELNFFTFPQGLFQKMTGDAPLSHFKVASAGITEQRDLKN
jgi:hypothetical protein